MQGRQRSQEAGQEGQVGNAMHITPVQIAPGVNTHAALPLNTFCLVSSILIQDACVALMTSQWASNTQAVASLAVEVAVEEALVALGEQRQVCRSKLAAVSCRFHHKHLKHMHACIGSYPAQHVTGWLWCCPRSAGGDGGSAGRPILVELLEMLRYSWMVFWNLALFLAFANVLHKWVYGAVVGRDKPEPFCG